MRDPEFVAVLPREAAVGRRSIPVVRAEVARLATDAADRAEVKAILDEIAELGLVRTD